jgi:hypothetical protein
MVSIKNMKISILKNFHGTRIIYFDLSNIKLLKKSKDENSDLTLTLSTHIDYLNRRNQAMEPLLERWTMKLVHVCKDNSYEDILLCNDENEEDKNELPYIKEHLNSLNINITAPFVETMFEAMKIYSGKIYEA